jgi:hypothetical protein
MKETKHSPNYVAAGCAIYTADDWRDGNNHGGKIVASTALNLIDEDHEDDVPENAETDFAETIVKALNTAPSLLAENARLLHLIARARPILETLTTSLREFKFDDTANIVGGLASDFELEVAKARLALAEGGAK